MEQLAAKFPQFVSLQVFCLLLHFISNLVKVIGKTSEGQNMVVVTVGRNGGNNDRPGIFIEGGIHARCN